MKIVTTVRTLNEQENISAFYSCYAAWVDKILVADGGSTDDTVRRAKTYKKIAVRNFTEKVTKNGVWRNPQGKHINFLLDWAFEEEQADWVIFDDCDCFPNYLLQSMGRHLFETAELNGYTAIYAHRLYIYMDKYFPGMNAPGQSIWAWSKNSGIRASLRDPIYYELLNMPAEEQGLKLEHPYVLLHKAWPDEATIQRKQNFYEKIRGIPQDHPLKFGGQLASLPPYARVDTPPLYEIPEEEKE